MKPEWKTPEFWTSLLLPLVAALAAIGVFSPESVEAVKSAIGEGVTALFVLAACGATIWASFRRPRPPGGEPPAPPLPPITPLAILVLIALASRGQAQERSSFTASPAKPKATLETAQAQRLAQVREEYRQTCCLLGSSRTDPQVIALLQRIAAQQERMIALLERGVQTPVPSPLPPPTAPAPIIIIPPGSGGTPRYELPPGGTPRYELPPGGNPRYELPPGGTPRYELPPGGSPRHELPPGGTPKYDLVPKPPPATVEIRGPGGVEYRGVPTPKAAPPGECPDGRCPPPGYSPGEGKDKWGPGVDKPLGYMRYTLHRPTMTQR